MTQESDFEDIKSRFDDYWQKILNLIDEKDKRISSSLYDQKVRLNNDTIEIDLGETDNTYEQKMLDENIDLIENSIYQIINHKLKIKIESKMKEEEKEENHPLLNEIKTKFTNTKNS